MNSEIKKWENIILSGKKVDPKNKEQEAAFDIAYYFVTKEKERKAA